MSDTRLRPRARLPFYEDGPDAFVVGEPRDHKRATPIDLMPENTELLDLYAHQTPHHILDTGIDVCAGSRAQLMYLVRNEPQRFDTRLVGAIHARREQAIDTMDMYDWDCDVCRSSVVTRTLADRCPMCGAA